MYFIPYCYSKYGNLISFYTKSCGCTTPEQHKNALVPKGKQGLDSSSSACPYHSLPGKAPCFWVGALCFSAWEGQSLGAASGASGRSIPPTHSHCPEPCLQCEVVPVQGTGRSKPCSPLALSEVLAGSFTCGNSQGVLHAALRDPTWPRQ